MTDQELAALRSELETLRRTNAELTTKLASRKARIAELEASNTESQTQLTTARGELHELTVGTPLKAMAESISNVPELWIEQFGKSYRLEMVKGELSIVSVADGKPVVNGAKAVPFERQALVELLTGKDHPQKKVFDAITIASKASGGNAPLGRRAIPTAPKPSVRKFGLS